MMMARLHTHMTLGIGIQYPTFLDLTKNLATRWGSLWGVHEQYLRDLWAPGHAVLCAWKPERRSFTHNKSTLL